MCQEKEEQNSPVLSMALMHQYTDSRIAFKETRKDELQQPVKSMPAEKIHKNTEKYTKKN